MAFSAQAERVEVRGVGTIQFEGKVLASSKPTDQEKLKALAAAKLSAWNNYVATLNASQQQSILSRPDEFQKVLDSFVLDYVVIDTVLDPSSRTLKTVVRAAFNDTAVEKMIHDVSVSYGAGPARSANSSFTFIFLARQETSIQQFDARRTAVEKTQQADTMAADGGSSHTLIAETGGSTLQKVDGETFAVASSQDLDASMGGILTASGVDYVGYDDIVGNCSAPPTAQFQDEYVSHDELTPHTRATIVKAVQSCDIRYLATGTIDTGVASRDPVSGSLMVYVSVRAQLWDVNKDERLPHKIGSVGPKQYSGLGTSQAVAARAALNVAAKSTAQELIDQLNVRTIR